MCAGRHVADEFHAAMLGDARGGSHSAGRHLADEFPAAMLCDAREGPPRGELNRSTNVQDAREAFFRAATWPKNLFTSPPPVLPICRNQKTPHAMGSIVERQCTSSMVCGRERGISDLLRRSGSHGAGRNYKRTSRNFYCALPYRSYLKSVLGERAKSADDRAGAARAERG